MLTWSQEKDTENCRYITTKNIQLDWPRIAEWAYAGIFAVAVQVQKQDQFWISHQKKQG